MGAGAYLLWGVFPAFFPLLEPAAPTEILAHRVVWTLVLMLGLLAVTGRLGRLRGMPARTWLLVAAASALISVNWGTYILAVNSGRVVEASLGYFINPLVSVLLGVVVLRERLRRGQWVAVAVAAVAVVALTIDYGRPPVVALVLACSFGTYGLIKKTIPLDPRTSLTAEGLVAAPFAIAFLVFLQLTGASTFVSEGPAHVVLLVVTGLVTAVPLLLFAGSAQRVPLTVIGILQYLTPVMQFLFGILVRHEDMPASRWFGFALIWTALVVFTVETVHHARRRSPDALTAAGAPA
jgi:chloramphenicol-sensitive protein RarD